MKKIYFANALFSEAELIFNERVAQEIEKLGYEVYLPQRNDSINDKTASATAVQIYYGDRDELDKSDILVAVLDGVVLDPGVAAEIGYMAAKGKPILGLFTDSRENSKTVNAGKLEALNHPMESQFPYVNLFVVGAIKDNGKIFTSTEQLIEHLESNKS